VTASEYGLHKDDAYSSAEYKDDTAAAASTASTACKANKRPATAAAAPLGRRSANVVCGREIMLAEAKRTYFQPAKHLRFCAIDLFTRTHTGARTHTFGAASAARMLAGFTLRAAEVE